MYVVLVLYVVIVLYMVVMDPWWVTSMHCCHWHEMPRDTVVSRWMWSWRWRWRCLGYVDMYILVVDVGVFKPVFFLCLFGCFLYLNRAGTLASLIATICETTRAYLCLTPL